MKKFSLNRLMHNDRAMIAFSLVLAVLVWFSVVSGPGNTTTRSIVFKVNTAITNGDLQVIGAEPVEVEVEVEGTLAVVSKLTAEDIRVRLDASEIQGVGNQELTVLASRNSSETGYEILTVSPSTVTVFCDHWVDDAVFIVEPDISAVKADQSFTLGEAIVDPNILADGNVTLQGPESVISRVNKVVARITEEAVIAEPKTFTAQLLALDEQGAEIDLSQCHVMAYERDDEGGVSTVLTELTGRTLEVTVPVETYQEITFSYQTAHQPSGLTDLSSLITISPPSITLIGDKAALEACADQLADLGTLDFDKISPENNTFTIPLNLPENVRVLEGVSEVKVTFNTKGYSKKVIELNLEGTKEYKPLEFQNVPEGTTVTPRTKTLSVTLVGPTRTLSSIREKDLSVVIDMGESDVGFIKYLVRVNIKDYNNVWVYYGEENADGFEIYVTVQ